MGSLTAGRCCEAVASAVDEPRAAEEVPGSSGTSAEVVVCVVTSVGVAVGVGVGVVIDAGADTNVAVGAEDGTSAGVSVGEEDGTSAVVVVVVVVGADVGAAEVEMWSGAEKIIEQGFCAIDCIS